MIDASDLTIESLVLECLPRTRWASERAFWERYNRLCAKWDVLPLMGQVKTTLRRLKHEGKIIVTREGARKA
jgi:hypothetical protein